MTAPNNHDNCETTILDSKANEDNNLPDTVEDIDKNQEESDQQTHPVICALVTNVIRTSTTTTKTTKPTKPTKTTKQTKNKNNNNNNYNNDNDNNNNNNDNINDTHAYLPGTTSGLIRKLTQLTITNIQLGRYTWNITTL